jgi:flagellar protein FliJ
MKARDATLRLKRFEADEHTRKVANLESMIRDFQAMAADLDRQIQAEEDRTGVKDANHFAYSTFAKSAAQRRNNLRASAVELTAKLEASLKARNEAVEQLAQVSASEPRELQRGRRRIDRSSGATPLR